MTESDETDQGDDNQVDLSNLNNKYIPNFYSPRIDCSELDHTYHLKIPQLNAKSKSVAPKGKSRRELAKEMLKKIQNN